MLRRFRLHSPFVMLRHPIFQYETRRVGWAWSGARLWAYTRRIVIGMHVLALVTWLLLLGLWRLANPGIDPFYSYYAMENASSSIIAIMMAVLILANTVLDFVSLQVALNSISGEELAGRWDLLRLTALTEQGIIRAKLARLWLRVWRFTAVIVGARAATVALSLITLFIVPYITTGYNDFVEGVFYSLIDDPLSVLLLLAITVITILMYIIEPFWRMQGMTALGMVLSAYIRNIPLATLAAVGTMFGIWLLQSIIVIALVVGLGWFGGLIFSGWFYYTYIDSDFPIVVYILFACIITALTIYGFYALMQTWSLRRVLYRLNKRN